MAPKNIYLHIGYHKTGTTSIQYALAKNQKSLLDHGYLYPASGQKWNAHHNLVWQYQENKRYDRFNPTLGTWEECVQEINATHVENVIISSEDFCRSRDATIEKIKLALADHNVKIVVYLRRQDQYLQSKWVQIAKLGMWLPDFPVWASSEVDKDRFLDYDFVIKKWSDRFGIENIIVRPFERSQFQGDLIEDFLRACGISDSSWFNSTGSKNVSPSVQAMSVIREITSKLPKLSLTDVTRPQFKVLMARTRDFIDVVNKDYQKINLIDQKLHHKIMKNFQESNKIVAQTYLGKEHLFQESFKEKPLSSFDEVSLDKNILFQLLVQVFQIAYGKNMDNEESKEENKNHIEPPASPRQIVSNLLNKSDDDIKRRIIVYQMGKVASTSIVNSLNTLPGIAAYQSHFLGENSLKTILSTTLDLDIHPFFFENQKQQLIDNIDLTRMVLEAQAPQKNSLPLGIVSTTREPLDWFRSQIVQQLPGYINDFVELANVSNKNAFNSDHISLVLQKLKENFKIIIQDIGLPLGPKFAKTFFQKYLPQNKNVGTDMKISQKHFKSFMRPFLWYPKMVTPIFDIDMQELKLNDQNFALLERDWGFFYLFRFEEVEDGFDRLVDMLGHEKISLSKENRSNPKQFSAEIKSEFVKWKEDLELMKLIESSYTKRFRYSNLT